VITTANATEDGDDKDKAAVTVSFSLNSESEFDQEVVKRCLERIKGTIGSFILMLADLEDRKFYADYIKKPQTKKEHKNG